MDNTYRPRWSAVLAVAGPTGLVYGALGAGFATLVGLLLGWSETLRMLPVMGPVLVVISMIASMLRLRGRRLTVRGDSLLVDRDGLRVTVMWNDLAEVRERRLGPVRVEELMFRAAAVQPPLNMDITSWRAARFRRIQPALYVADWRESPLGAACPAC